MFCDEQDQRQHHALREHIDSLLARGASLVGRDPVRLSLEGRALTVQHGMLLSEGDSSEQPETIAACEWPGVYCCGVAMAICLESAQPGSLGKSYLPV